MLLLSYKRHLQKHVVTILGIILLTIRDNCSRVVSKVITTGNALNGKKEFPLLLEFPFAIMAAIFFSVSIYHARMR